MSIRPFKASLICFIFLIESVVSWLLSWPLSFFLNEFFFSWTLSWSSAFFLERVLFFLGRVTVFLTDFFFSCRLFFLVRERGYFIVYFLFFSFINSQPWGRCIRFCLKLTYRTGKGTCFNGFLVDFKKRFCILFS